MPSSIRNFGKLDDRVARGFVCALARRLVEPLVVGERMRIGPDAVRVHQRRAVPFAAVRGRRCHGAVGGREIGAVHLDREQIRESRASSFEMCRPAVWLSTGTEIA